MQIQRFVTGPYQTNCYLLKAAARRKDCVIIDPGPGSEQLTEHLQQDNLHPEAILLTHGHADHIAGVNHLRASWPKVTVCIHHADAQMLTNPKTNLSELVGELIHSEPPELTVQHDQLIHLAGLQLTVIHTPGHTPGSISLYSKSDQVLFCGDALFANSIGRTDFPGGDMNQLINSIRKKLFSLPPQTKVYPGHGIETSIAREKKFNPFLR